MIRYTLRCAADHAFDSWFQSASAFDTLNGAGHLSCPDCGSTDITKALMAPAIRPTLTEPATPREQALAELRRTIEDNSDYVGDGFVAEARRMHEGDAPRRAIHGEARLDEARKLLEDGIPVAPLPFLPARRSN